LLRNLTYATISAKLKLRFASMTLGLAVGVTAAVVVACTAAAYVYSKHHFRALLDDARAGALAQGELIRVALEHQMIENDRTLIARMIESFRAQARFEQIAIFDRNGVERFHSGTHAGAAELRLISPSDQSGISRVIETRGGAILRTVIPIHNREACYRCHDSRQTINGVLVLDYNAGEVRSAMTSDLRRMVAGAAGLTLLLVGAIVLVIRVSVLRRLQRFETTARLIAAGDLARRVPAEGADTISWLAREFNAMAESVTGLVGEVRTQQERLEMVINSIDDGIVVLDPQRKIVAANDAFLRRAGASRDIILGCNCKELGAGGCAVSDCPTLGCLSDGQRQVRICERRTLDGAVAWEEVHASPILDAGGRLTQVVEVWRDISERRAAEAHLAESHRLASIGVLASGFSHELNTPLATVLMCVEGILRDTPEASFIRHNAAIAREQVLRCRGITQHFLRMSRGQPGSAAVIDVGGAIEAVNRLIEPTARAHSVRVEVGQPPEPIHVRADEAEFQNALINLLLNAVQACQPGGRVAIAAGRSDGHLRIRVSDNGCGIAAENRTHIFEPFFSLRKGGTGLGLFLTLNFVRRCGGDISVESAPGQGAAFEIVLPALVPEAAG
jgi:two-component system NtrC family sensor kinase